MSSENETIKGIPYGISDYGIIRRDNYYYVDKTHYLEKIQDAGRYLFLIRPRRFGKSLLLSMMEAYYDVLLNDRFEELFKGTRVFEHPTKEQGKYLVLSFNFSAVNPDPAKAEAAFLSHVQDHALNFIRKYDAYLSANPNKDFFIEKIKQSRIASDILSSLLVLSEGAQQKLYVLIDEYDNFANTILSTAGTTGYKSLTHGEGFFRSFFNVLKAGTGGMDAPITRLFFTGVSPITLDDVTSGYNIGKNISVDHAFNQLLGFTKEDVIDMIEYYKTRGRIEHDTEYIFEIMRSWYNNYKFSKESRTTLFNSDMVLYFLDEYFKVSRVPDELIDRNARIDYGKLRYLIIIDRRKGKKETNGNFSRLREIIENGQVTERLKKGFPLDEMELAENFTSLLFYFGLLTIAGKEEGKICFKIPNQTVRSLFYDYIIRISRETGLLDVDISELHSLLHDMAFHGNWQPYFEYISGRMNESVSIRDFIRGEKVIQGFLLAYLGISDYFIVHSEKELNMGYGDIVMEPFLSAYEDIKYSYIIEIKYIPRGENKRQKALESKIEKLKKEAEEQLEKYTVDERFKKTIGKTTLIKLILIYSGSELEYIGRPAARAIDNRST